ncbi:hypothetical protein [Aeromicrobium sp. UC242_57]|uniref:hypothetical protein n=1 Tax=Aeromicrobium sp. UC242_57 TaxID=3374624 RepID=UPI0037A52D48
MYDTILSQPGLSYAGVLDYIPGRLASLAKGNSAKKVEASVEKLVVARFVVVDEATAELLIRSFVRHDGVLARANMGKAVARAYGKVLSPKVRNAVLDELARAYNEGESHSGLSGFADIEPDAMADVIERAERIAS